MHGAWVHGTGETEVSKPELISDYAHSELNLGVEKRRPGLLPMAVGREIAKRPIITTTAVVLLAAAAAGATAGIMMGLRARKPGAKRFSLADLLR